MIDNLEKDKNSSLSVKAVKGGVWVFIIQVVKRILSLGRLILLARLLQPKDFGLMGIALLTMSILDIFSKTGFMEKLIQKKENIEDYLNTAWTVLVFRGIFIFAFMIFISSPVSTFFESPDALNIIRLVALSPLLIGLQNIGIVYFRRNLQFNKQFIYEVSGTAIDFVVAVVFAIIFRSVYALVFGLLAGDIIRLIVSYILSPVRPRFCFLIDKAKDMYIFGRWVLGSGILVFIATQGDDIFVGKLLGVAALGFYQMAYKISTLVVTEVTYVIEKVSFPVYAKIQDNLIKLKQIYTDVLKLTAFVTIPIGGFIFIFSEQIVEYFLGKNWLPIIPILKILSIAGVVRSLVGTAGSLIRSIDKPQIETFWLSLIHI